MRIYYLRMHIVFCMVRDTLTRHWVQIEFKVRTQNKYCATAHFFIVCSIHIKHTVYHNVKKVIFG